MHYVKINFQPISFLKILFFTKFLFFTISHCNSQNLELSGKISDTLNNSLQNANVLAIPASQGQEIKFSITNADGNYTLSLKKNSTYSLEISYLGYKMKYNIMKYAFCKCFLLK